MTGKTFAGERCFLHCAPGYKPAGRRVSVCTTDLRWKPRHELKCVPIQGTKTNTDVPAPLTAKPHIQCPQDVVKIMPKGHDTVFVKLDRPITNVDWFKNVDTSPAWGKQLEANLPLGTIEITFRARSSNSHQTDTCRVIVRVIGKFLKYF
jgi:hypothetical protein